jgi:hypothetical protein
MDKRETNGAHKASTHTKRTIDPKWDVTTLNDFSKKLTTYGVSLKDYQASFGSDINAYTTEEETGDDNSMDLSPSQEDIITSPPPTRPPRIAIQTIASSSTNYGFITPPPPRSQKSLQRRQTQTTEFFATAGNATPQKQLYPTVTQAKKKNRIEPIEQPILHFASPRRDIPPPSQEYACQNI